MSNDTKADALPEVTNEEQVTEVASSKEDYFKSEIRKISLERDKFKAEFKAIQEMAEKQKQKALEESNQYKELYEKLNPEYESLKQFKQSYEERMAQKVSELEGKLDESAKVEYNKFISKLPLDDKAEWLNTKLANVTINEPIKNSPASGRVGGSDGIQKSVEKMSFEERAKVLLSNPLAFKKAI